MSIVLRRLSHIGRRPIPFDSRVCLDILPAISRPVHVFGQTPVVKQVHISGPLGSLTFPIHKGLAVSLTESPVENEKLLTVGLDTKVLESMPPKCRSFVKSMWGTTASIIRQHVEGVLEGHQVMLRLVGIGYRAFLDNGCICLKVGHSHDVRIPVPSDIVASIPVPTKIVLRGPHLQRVTQLAAIIRSKRKPEPYNGKGIFVDDETIKLKEGKKKK